MKVGICSVAVLISAMGVVTNVAAVAENNSGLAPLATQAEDTSSQPDYLLNTCNEVPSAGGAVTAMNMVDPAGWLVGTVLTQEHRQVSAQEGEALIATVKLTQLQGVVHGQLISHSPNGKIFYEYRSEPGYVGNDQAIFMAEFQGKRYKIVANVVVSMAINDNDPKCSEPQLIKVNGKPISGAATR